MRNKQTHVKQKRKLTKLSTEKGKPNLKCQTLSEMYTSQKKYMIQESLKIITAKSEKWINQVNEQINK